MGAAPWPGHPSYQGEEGAQAASHRVGVRCLQAGKGAGSLPRGSWSCPLPLPLRKSMLGCCESNMLPPIVLGCLPDRGVVWALEGSRRALHALSLPLCLCTYSHALARLCTLSHVLTHLSHPSVQISSVAQSRPTLCDPMDCSLSGSSVHGILQARILEWVAIPCSRGSP